MLQECFPSPHLAHTFIIFSQHNVYTMLGPHKSNISPQGIISSFIEMIDAVESLSLQDS